MKVLIINFNRLILPQNMANWLSSRGCEPIFIDNNSTYPPLIEYYNDCPYPVYLMGYNYGHKVIWETDILNQIGIKGNYIVTDPDLDLTGIPDDFVEVLQEGLNRYPIYGKCGFSLEINDLPDIESNISVRMWEDHFWIDPLDSQYFRAAIDTTFALYRTNRFSFNSLRTNRPYTARHVPWYYKQLSDLQEDEQYYFTTAGKSCSGNKRLKR